MTLKFILIGRRLYNSTQIIAIPPIMPDLDSDITIAKINSKANNCITNIQNLEEIDFIHNNIKGKPIDKKQNLRDYQSYQLSHIYYQNEPTVTIEISHIKLEKYIQQL